jgi:hypothetical protein
MEDCPQLVVNSTYNGNRGPTDKQSDETPFEAKLRTQLEKRVGSATSPQAGMGDTMPDTKSVFTD